MKDAKLVFAQSVQEIVTELLQALKAGGQINVGKTISQVSKRNKLSRAPKLVDIIAAIPE